MVLFPASALKKSGKFRERNQTITDWLSNDNDSQEMLIFYVRSLPNTLPI